MKVYPHELGAEEIMDLLSGVECPVMLELGCNDGSDTLKFLAAIPNVQLFCFEPDARAQLLFKERVNSPQVRLFGDAISDKDGWANWWSSGGIPDCSGPGEWNKSGSICRPTGHLKRSPEITFAGGMQVSAVRLDTWLKGARIHGLVGDRIDFIWADLQGAEMKFIKGASEALGITRYLYTEYYNEPQYEGQPSLEQIKEALPGFQLVATYGGMNALFQRTG
jgi:FkbM family methyltransferase